MSKPKYVAAYPRQLMAFVIEFENTHGKLTVRAFSTPQIARSFRSELWGLRNAIRREGLSGDFPFFMSARVYLREVEVAVVSADQLPYAQEIDPPAPRLNDDTDSRELLERSIDKGSNGVT